MGEVPSPRRRSILARVFLGLVALVVLVVVGIHLAPIRGLVLRSVLPLADSRGIRVRVQSLDYNLFRLSATVRGVTVAANRTPDDPFFEADSVSVGAPTGVLRGIFSLTYVTIAGGHVKILRTPDYSNLPTSSTPSASEPPVLRLGHITGDVSVDVRDEVARYSAQFARMDLDLSPTGGRLQAGAGRVGIRDQVMNVSRMEGGAAFDGRIVTFSGMNLASDTTNVQIDGPLTVVTRSPVMDLQLRGLGDVAKLTAIATPTKIFDGRITFEGRVAGPFGSPVANLRVMAERLDRDKLSLTDVDLTTRVDVRTADVSQSSFTFAGGRVEAVARVAFDGSGTHVEGKWANVDVPGLLNSVVQRPPELLPAGRSAGTLTSDGRGFDLSQWTTAADLAIDPTSNARNRLALPGRSQLRIREGVWRLDGRHVVGDVAPVGFTLNGRIRGDGRIPMGGALELAPTTVPALTSMLTTVGIADIPPATFTAGTATATSMVGGELAKPTMTGTAQVEGLRGAQYAVGPARIAFDGTPLDGTFQLDVQAERLDAGGQALTGVVASGQVRGAELVVTSFAGTEAEASGMVRGSGRYLFASRSYQIQGEASDWTLRSTERVPAKGTVDATFTGEGTLDRPAGQALATVRDAFYQDLPLGTITARASLDGDNADVDVDVPQLNATGKGRSSLTAPYAAVADVTVRALDLSRLQPLLGMRNFTLQGTATATARAQGDLASWQDARVDVDLAAAEGVIGKLALTLDGPAQVFYNSGSVGTPRLALRSGMVQAEVRGSLPIEAATAPEAAMTMTLIGDLGDLVTAARQTEQVDVPAISGTGPVAVLARIEGSVRQPDVSADLDIGPASLTIPDVPTFERLRVLGHVEDGVADIQDAFAVVSGAEITATASAPLSWLSPALPPPSAGAAAMAKLTAQLKNVTADLLGRLATGSAVPDLAGSLDATVDVTSTTPALTGMTGEARIDRLELVAAGVAVTQQMPTRVVAENGTARIVSWNWSGEGTMLSLAGNVGLGDLTTELQANGELDLRLLTPFLRTAGIATAGSLTPRLLVTGKLNQPRVDGDITLTDAEMRVASPRVFVSGLSGVAQVNRDRLDIPQMNGTINGGTLIVGGSVLFLQGGASTVALTADISGMALEYPEGLRTELDGSLMFDLGQESEGLERIPLLLGSLHVVNGSYREPVTVVGGILAAAQSRVSTVPPPVTSPGFLDTLVLDITLVTDDDIVVDNNAATMSLDADVRMIGTAAQPALSGRAEVREGGRVLLGRNTYQVTSASLDFANPTKIDPDINAELTTRAGGTQIDLALTGTLSAPMLSLSSPDGELAQSDLTSLLLTGRTMDQLGTADAAVVGDVLVGNLSGEVGQVLGLAGRVVGIDAIRLGGVDNSVLQSDPGAIATETDPTSRLTFTKSLGANFDLTFSQSLREGDKQTWVIEYRPSRRLIARLVSDDDDMLRYEFRHDVRFGSNPMGRASERRERVVARVSEVNIQGELPGQDVRGMLSLEPGKRFDFETLQDDRERLENFYRTQGYLTVRVGARQIPSADTVAVEFTIQPGPRTRLDVTGEPLSRNIVDAVTALWSESIAGPLLVDEVRGLVADRLAGEGYPRAMVNVALSSADGVQVLTVSATRGQRTTTVLVMLDGVTGDLSDELSDRLAAEGIVEEAPRNQAAIANSLESGLKERGYMQPRIAVESAVYEGETATVTAHIEPGPQVLLGPVSVTGSTLDIDSVRAALDLTEGLSYLQAAVDNAQPRLTSFYRQEGFPNATVMIETVPRPQDGVIAVSVTVDEGPRQTITTVRVDGLRKIDEDVAQNTMNLKAGQAARAEDVLRARTRLYATGLFRRVDVSTLAEPDDAAMPNQLPVSIVATVEEWPMLRFRYGLQVAEEHPEDDPSRRSLVPGISADVMRRTLFGRAVTIGAAAVLQRRDSLARIFVNAPTFWNRAIRSSFNVEAEREELRPNVRAETVGFSWEQRTKLFDHLTLSYAYRFERTHAFNIVPDFFIPLDDTTNVSRLTGAVAWDSRSDPATPVSGSLISASVEHAPNWMGSQFRFFRFFTQARHFEAWRGTVFASSFQYGNINPIGQETVILTERFFTGGSTSVRGLPEDGAGPRDVLGPTGGRVLLLLNQEARVPLYRWFQGVAFVDAGNVFAGPGASIGGLVTSVGAGLRVVTPFALLRVDFGHIVNGAINNSPGRWSVGIGHIF